MTKHTNGPWTLEQQDGDFVDISGRFWGGFARICVKMEDEEKNKPEGEANLKLLFAAPDLLRACKAIDTEGRDANRDGDVIISSEVWDLIQQAIQKAT